MNRPMEASLFRAGRRCFRVAALAASLTAFGAVEPALADGPVALVLGGAFPQGAPYYGQPAQFNVSASYDLGPKLGPYRLSLGFDYATGGAELNDYGFTAGLRLTTPVYAGLTLGVYTANAQQACAYPGAGGGGSPIGAYGSCPGLSASGFGSTYFVGVRLFSSRAADLSIQAGYRQVPLVGGINPSGPNVGLRVQL